MRQGRFAFSTGQRGDQKIVLKNYKNIKDEFPNVIDINSRTGEVSQISKDHDKMTISQFRQQTKMKAMNTFLPNGYPHTVSSNYFKFCVVSNIGAVSFTIMGFLSTQSLFVALGR